MWSGRPKGLSAGHGNCIHYGVACCGVFFMGLEKGSLFAVQVLFPGKIGLSAFERKRDSQKWSVLGHSALILSLPVPCWKVSDINKLMKAFFFVCSSRCRNSCVPGCYKLNKYRSSIRRVSEEREDFNWRAKVQTVTGEDGPVLLTHPGLIDLVANAPHGVT